MCIIVIVIPIIIISSSSMIVVCSISSTVGFNNFNLRIFNLRVSNPNKLIVDVFFDTSDFNVPGSRPDKNTMKFRKSTVLAAVAAARRLRRQNAAAPLGKAAEPE